ncbi:MAG: hypothetical protein ABJE95_00550 [Byssovorax sp.]
MFERFAGAVALAVVLVGCGGSEPTGGSGTTGGAVTGHALGMNVALTPKSGKLSFLTPSNTIAEQAATSIVGKPYLIAAFPAGFAPGNDPPLEYAWGQMPDDLTVKFTSKNPYEDGPYDIVFVCYTATPITAEIKAGAPQEAPAAKGGDIASFTLSTKDIHMGDPKNPLGTLRLNVEGADAEASIANRTPMDPKNGDQVTAAFTNTVLEIP